MTPRKAAIVKFVASAMSFEVGWSACIFGAALGAPLLGAAGGLAVAGFQVWLRGKPRVDVPLILIASALGAAVDAGLLASGLLSFQGSHAVTATFLVWIFALWANFTATLNIVFRWLRGRLWLAGVLGAIAGPLTYWGGAKLGAVGLAEPPTWSLVALAVEWGLAMPALVWAFERFSGERGLRGARREVAG